MFRDSASARLSTAIAKKTFRRISEQRVQSRTNNSAEAWLYALQTSNAERVLTPLSTALAFLVCVCVYHRKKDTVSTDEEDDEVKAHNHSRRGRASVRHDPVIHHSIPVFSSQDLTRNVDVEVI